MAKIRARRTASIRRRGSRWQVRWTTADGRATSESFATEAEAKRAADRVYATQILTGAPPLTARDGIPTVSEWWARWEPGQPWAESSRHTHGAHWRRYIEPAWGRVALDAVTTADLQRWHRKLERSGLATSYVGGIHRTFAMLLGGAERDDLIPRNPASRCAPISRKAIHDPVALTDATVARIDRALAATEPRLRVFARLCADAGLRRGEAAGLTWDRVDLDRLTITIDRQLDFAATRRTREPQWSPTKNDLTRAVPITPALAADLRAQRSEYGIGASQLVFTDRFARAWNTTRLGEVWRAMRARLDEDGTPLPAAARGWHTLRHRYVSHLHDLNVPDVDIAAAVGHVDITTTRRVYMHQVDESAAHARIRDALA